MKIHRWLDLKVTRRCNNYSHRCGYCEVAIDPVSAPEQLPLETIHRCLLDARAMGFDIFWLLGGEPSIREDADHLIAPLAEDPAVMLTIVTNGKKRAQKMYLGLFATKAKRACIQVSLDTLTPNNFKRVDPAQSLRLITDLHGMAKEFSHDHHCCEVEVHCVISRENLCNFDEFARFCGAKGIPVSLAMVCPWKESVEPARFNEFTRAELLSICERIEVLRTGLPIDTFNPFVAAFVRSLLQQSRSETIRSCGAGLTHLVINGDGTVHRCMAESFRRETALGNIRTQRLHHVLHQVDQPRLCKTRADCFDGYAWDRLSLGET